MFNDDTSLIPRTGCNILSSNNQIQNYSVDRYTRKIFVFNGGKWYLQRTETQTYGWSIGSYECLSNDDLDNLNSNAQYVPFFYGMAFILFLVAVFAFFKSIKGFIYGI